MVAGWAPVKRHWHFFEALRSLPAESQVVLVGQPDGGLDRESLLALARECRVPASLDVLESLPAEKVATLQCDSRVSAIFSRREGCCVAVTESLMADSPVALLDGAHMGPAAYINEHTGCFLPHRRTGRALREFLERGESFRAREWALKHLANDRSAEKLASFLQRERESRGETWSGDLAVPVWRPHPYLPGGPGRELLTRALSDLHERYPALFPADLIESSRF